MSIQQSINQAIGIAGALATQTPMAAAHRENAVKNAALKSESKNLEAKGEILKGILEGETKGKNYPESIIDELGEEAVESKKRIAEIKPTEENIKSYLDTAKIVEEGKNIQEFKKRNAQRRAQYALKKAEQEAKADLEVRVQAKQKGRSKMGFETRKSVILDQYANPLEVKNER